METQRKNLIDVTGLPEEAVTAVRSLVSVLKNTTTGTQTDRSFQDWSRAFEEWINSHKPRGTNADFSRESIYADRGE
jgi:hypothetical protein